MYVMCTEQQVTVIPYSRGGEEQVVKYQTAKLV